MPLKSKDSFYKLQKEILSKNILSRNANNNIIIVNSYVLSKYG